MPLYDYQCPHGHRFEHMATIADRDKPIPCEGLVNQLVDDEIAEKALAMRERWKLNPDEIAIIGDVKVTFEMIGGEDSEPIVVTPVPCMLKAKRIEIAFSETNGICQSGMASNRDAAREGRYDPLNPNRRFMAKGRGAWRNRQKPK